MHLGVQNGLLFQFLNCLYYFCSFFTYMLRLWSLSKIFFTLSFNPHISLCPFWNSIRLSRSVGKYESSAMSSAYFKTLTVLLNTLSSLHRFRLSSSVPSPRIIHQMWRENLSLSNTRLAGKPVRFAKPKLSGRLLWLCRFLISLKMRSSKFISFVAFHSLSCNKQSNAFE